MILTAARELGLDLTRSVMVGDRRLDVACGHAAGVRAVLVRTGLGAAEEEALAEDARSAARCYPQQFDGGRRVDSAQLLALVAALKGRRVAVIGDVVADEFVYGRVARVSREAPVLILEYDSTEVVPGAGGNAANNAAALGADVTLATLVGTRRPDQAGAGRAARAGGSAPRGARARRHDAGEDADPGRRRAFRQAAGGAHRQGRGRGDRRRGRAAFERQALRACARADAVLVSDYGSGLVTPRLVKRAAHARFGAPAAARRSWWTRGTACCSTPG